jgi:hypothetical protein
MVGNVGNVSDMSCNCAPHSPRPTISQHPHFHTLHTTHVYTHTYHDAPLARSRKNKNTHPYASYPTFQIGLRGALCVGHIQTRAKNSHTCAYMQPRICTYTRPRINTHTHTHTHTHTDTHTDTHTRTRTHTRTHPRTLTSVNMVA